MKTHFKLFLLAVLCCTAGLCAKAQTTISNVINDYRKVTDIDFCTNRATVANNPTPAFAAGDRVMIIQMKGAEIDQSNTVNYGDITNQGLAGGYEFNEIASISGNDIYLAFAMLENYDPTAMVQIIRVPQYTAPIITVTSTLTCLPWNPSTGIGGVLVFEASNSQLVLQAGINVDGRGFRGGAPNNDGTGGCSNDYFLSSASNLGGFKGEGITDVILNQECGKGPLASGGGGGNDINSGGGGGGSFGNGGQGGDAYVTCSTAVTNGGGGNSYGASATDRLFLGSGGGGGHQNNTLSTAGGNGGGIIFIVAASIQGNGNSISANGVTAASVTYSGGLHIADGAGGGGGAGDINLVCTTFTNNINISAFGGDGGNVTVHFNHNHGPGGGGGGGRIRFSGAPTGVSSATTLGGSHGEVLYQSVSYGAHGSADGNNGTQEFSLSPNESTTPFQPITATVNGQESVTVCDGATVFLEAIGGHGNYEWVGHGHGNMYQASFWIQPVNVLHSGTWTVTSEGCTDEVEILVQNCCPAMDPANGYQIIDASSTSINTDQFWQGKILVTGGWLDVSGDIILDITNVDVVFDECSGMRIRNGALLRANNSVFRPCQMDRTWGGIEIQTTGSVIDECVFKNAVSAVAITEMADARVHNNLFFNNARGLFIVASSNFPYSISGNRFIVDKDIPVFAPCGGLDGVNYGIHSYFSSHDEAISQNEFVNYNLNPSNMFHGIMLDHSTATISSNTFTNMYRSVDITGASGYSSVENNKMEVTRHIGGLKYQVNIVNTFAPVHVFNNSISDPNETSVGSAIYAENQDFLYVKNNTILGFETGIHLANVDNGLVTENWINNSVQTGIYSENCDNLDVSCNEINLDFGSASGFAVGIMSVELSENSAIHSNCIRDCFTSLEFRSFAVPSPNLPTIRNNFLYNYTAAGIWSTGYNGNIGTPSQPGLNTFNSNSGAMDVVNSISGPVTSIFLYHNFNQINFSSNVYISGNQAYHSTASCGQQTQAPGLMQRNLDPSLMCDDYTSSIAPLYYEGGDFILKENSVNDDATNDVFHVMATALAIGDNAGQLNILLLETEKSGTLADEDNRMVEYTLAIIRKDFTAAKTILHDIHTMDSKKLLWLETEKLHLKVLGGEKPEQEDHLLIQQLAVGNMEVINLTSSLLMESGDRKDFHFALKKAANDKSYSGVVLRATQPLLELYPNPAGQNMNIRVVSGQTESVSVRIMDVSGKLVMEKSLEFIAGEASINISELAAGAYILHVLPSGEELLAEKFVKF